jgi:hypothetical protein
MILININLLYLKIKYLVLTWQKEFLNEFYCIIILE